MPAALPIAGLALGGLGLYQQSQQAKAQQDALMKATKPAEIQTIALKDQLKRAQAYDPHTEDAKAVSAASQNAGAVLSQQLKNLNSQFMASGGSPGGDTAFNVAATNTTNRVIDPLKQFQAQLAATETDRKMAALQSVLGAPAGQISNSYFNAAQFAQPNYGPSLSLFGDAFKKLFPGKAPGINAGGGAGIDPNSMIGLPGSTVGPDNMFFGGF